jgi:hypothetical protein
MIRVFFLLVRSFSRSRHFAALRRITASHYGRALVPGVCFLLTRNFELLISKFRLTNSKFRLTNSKFRLTNSKFRVTYLEIST